MNNIGLIAAIVSVFGVLLGGFYSYRDGALFPSQMLARGKGPGRSFLAHGGMIGDIVFVTPVIGLIYGHCWQAWDLITVAVFGSIGLAASMALHATYVRAPKPEAHVEGGRLTRAGKVHYFYMAWAIASIALFYFATPKQMIPGWLAVLSSLLLGIHIVCGCHIPLRLLKPEWRNDSISAQDVFTVLAVWSLLAWRTYALL